MPRSYSINQRTLLATTLVLVCFLGVVGWVLDLAFRDSAARGVQQNLESTLYGLIAVADLDHAQQLSIPAFLTDERLNRTGSGLYAIISNDQNITTWQSRSLVGREIPATSPLAVGERDFKTLSAYELFVYRAGIAWEVDSNQAINFTFHILTTRDNYHAQVQQFRTSLWGWLGAATIFLLVIHVLLLRWSLSPLRRVSDDLLELERGQQEQLGDHYPVELQGLTHNLNHLLKQRQHQLTRYRNALSDLAHSLKTPLAILRGIDSNDSTTNHQTVLEQTDQMTRIIDYQLQRAATAGQTGLITRLPARRLIERITRSLQKVYSEKTVQVDIKIMDEVKLSADENDLMELLGNLLDNAFKWANERIQIQSERNDEFDYLIIEDDGPGIDSDKAQQMLQRGMRADTATEGHGIGLAVCQEIINAYQGSIALRDSDLGGLQVILSLPK